MKIPPRNPLFMHLLKMAQTPKAQAKQLAIGTLLAIIIMLGLIFTSEYENQIIFYLLSSLLVVAVIYAVPGYIGIWVWRMRSVLFDNKNFDHKKTEDNQ
jgi:uncharacterized membrane protein YccC